MGDSFSNIHGSNIVNRSNIQASFNALNDSGQPELAKALQDIAAHLEEISASPEVVESYDNLAEEAAKPDRKASKLKAFWDQLVALAPSVATLASAAKAIAAVF